ncbi:hypothetical protein WN943_009541 [Citrus x changshan-huyou]
MKRNSSYSLALMRRHFANNNSLPSFHMLGLLENAFCIAHKLLTSWKPADKARGQGSPCCLCPPLCKDSGKALALEHPNKAEGKVAKLLLAGHQSTKAPHRYLGQEFQKLASRKYMLALTESLVG